MVEEEKKETKEEKKKTVKKGKKPHKNKPTSKKYKHYTLEGSTIKRDRTCPRCGSGVFFARFKDRFYCGKCHFTEFFKKSEENPETES